MAVKKAIVTGGSRGIGRGIAIALAKDGYDVAITYATKAEEAEQTAAAVAEYGRKCLLYQASLEEDGVGPRVVSQAIEDLGGLDLLVNNAGLTITGSILHMPVADIDKLINLDFRNYLLCAQVAARYMAAHQVRGNIISITSSRAQRAYPGDAVYGGIKAGLNRATESMALDLAPYGIRVNCIGPGAIRVRTDEQLAKPDERIKGSFYENLGWRIPMQRVGDPEDIGNAVVFLASEKAAYITGFTLRVDGGLILPGMPERVEEDAKDMGWGYVKID